MFKKIHFLSFCMEEQDIYQILDIILQELEGHSLMWRLDGSANLRVQGVDVRVNDLDVKTNTEGLRVFKACLKEYFVKEFYKEEIEGDVVEFVIHGFPIEVINNKYNMLHRIKKISVRGLSLPILPLREAREFYKAIGRKEKVALLDTYLY